MTSNIQGIWRKQAIGSPEPYNAFIPYDLPPQYSLDRALLQKLSAADQAIGRLDGMGNTIPNVDLFIYFYCRREAVLSSQIEGTQSTLSELLLFEINKESDRASEDVREVSNYVAAMRHGMLSMQDGFPLSLRLIREMHKILLGSGRGREKNPGEFRTSQNWIGGSRPGDAIFVPTPPDVLPGNLDAFEKFLHGGAAEHPVLLQAAMLHYQFETIHPFLDGNGRIGRLLVPLLLIERKVLREPLLYLSLYLKQNRDRYFSLLQKVRMEGAWNEWFEFFLEAGASAANQAVELAKQLTTLVNEDELRIRQRMQKSKSLLLAFQQLPRTPIFRIADLRSTEKMSFTTVQKGIAIMLELGMIRETTGRQRNQVYRYERYLSLLGSGME